MVNIIQSEYRCWHPWYSRPQTLTPNLKYYYYNLLYTFSYFQCNVCLGAVERMIVVAMHWVGEIANQMVYYCVNIHYKIKLSCKLKILVFCMSLQAGCYCSPPNLHMSSRLIMSYQEHWWHEGKKGGHVGAFNRLLNDAVYEKAFVFPKLILSQPVKSFCSSLCRIVGTHEGRQLPTTML